MTVKSDAIASLRERTKRAEYNLERTIILHIDEWTAILAAVDALPVSPTVEQRIAAVMENKAITALLPVTAVPQAGDELKREYQRGWNAGYKEANKEWRSAPPQDSTPGEY